MKDKKRTFETFFFYDRSGMEARFEQMAAKGWLIEAINSSICTYRRIEPKKLTFCVCWYPDASQFDPGPSEKQQTFYDFCQHTGWVLAVSSGPMQVFYNENEHPIPIETDPVLEVEAIHRSMTRGPLPGQVCFLGLAVLNLWLFVSRLLDDPLDTLASTLNLIPGLLWFDLILILAVECGGYLLWHRKAAKAAQEGDFLKTNRRKGVRRFVLALLALNLLCFLIHLINAMAYGSSVTRYTSLIMFLVYLPGVFLLTYGVRALLKKKKYPAHINRAATFTTSLVVAFLFLFCITWGTLAGTTRGWFTEKGVETYTYHGATFTAPQDELPLTIKDLTHETREGYSREKRVESSPFLAQYQMRVRPRFDAANFAELPALEYTITVVKLTSLYDLCKNELLEGWTREWQEEGEKDYAEPVSPAPWGADDAYQQYNQEYGAQNTFLLCYDKRLVEISFPNEWTLTPEQMKMVSEKLRTFEN